MAMCFLQLEKTISDESDLIFPDINSGLSTEYLTANVSNGVDNSENFSNEETLPDIVLSIADMELSNQVASVSDMSYENQDCSSTSSKRDEFTEAGICGIRKSVILEEQQQQSRVKSQDGRKSHSIDRFFNHSEQRKPDCGTKKPACCAETLSFNNAKFNCVYWWNRLCSKLIKCCCRIIRFHKNDYEFLKNDYGDLISVGYDCDDIP